MHKDKCNCLVCTAKKFSEYISNVYGILSDDEMNERALLLRRALSEGMSIETALPTILIPQHYYCAVDLVALAYGIFMRIISFDDGVDIMPYMNLPKEAFEYGPGINPLHYIGKNEDCIQGKVFYQPNTKMYYYWCKVPHGKVFGCCKNNDQFSSAILLHHMIKKIGIDLPPYEDPLGIIEA